MNTQVSNMIKQIENKYLYNTPSESGSLKYEYSEETNSDEFSKSHCQGLECFCCKNLSDKKGYIILSCNCVYHINCLVELHMNDLQVQSKFTGDDMCEFKCVNCNDFIDKTDMLHLHNKFKKYVSSILKNHNNTIDELERKIVELKTELNVCYEYKHKLQYQNEKSKQIIHIINTL